MPSIAPAPLPPKTIELTWKGRLHAAASCAHRLVYGVALVNFTTVYFFLAVPSDYEVQPVWLLVQPVIFIAIVVGWRAVGHPIRATGVAALALLLLFAASYAWVIASIAGNRSAIMEYSERFPDGRWHSYAMQLGPDGPYIVFLAVLTPVMLILFAGAIAALILRVWRIGGVGTTLAGTDRRVRDEVARAGDAPSLIPLIDASRWRGVAAGLAAALVLMSPLLLSGREVTMPSASGIAGWLPDLIARLVTFVHDRIGAVAMALVAASGLWRLALWYLSPEARFVLAADKRPPILLLRSFKDDHAALSPVELWRRLLHLPLWPVRAGLRLIGMKSVAVALHGVTRRRLEEVAAQSLRDAGPFIAVGDRGERPPELGAFRAQLADDEWQDYVRCWLRTSRIIVLVAGRTHYLQWELRTATELGALGKLILLMPPGSASETAARWALVVECLAATPWHDDLVQIDPRRLLAMSFRADGRVTTLRSRRRGERDYDLAIRIGQGMVVG